jgi:hypothetical protein
MQIRPGLFSFHWLPFGSDRKYPKVLIGLEVAFTEKNEASVARPVRRLSQPAQLSNPLWVRGAADIFAEQPVIREHNGLATSDLHSQKFLKTR